MDITNYFQIFNLELTEKINNKLNKSNTDLYRIKKKINNKLCSTIINIKSLFVGGRL